MLAQKGVIKMNKEILSEQLANSEAKSPEVKILTPGMLTVEKTAENLISLLQAMYVEHGITKNREKLVGDISSGNVLTWFAEKDRKMIGTASLVKQSDGAWELGRAVSLDRGNGIGKRVILEALRFHLENHTNLALTAEVRAASEFKGIPSGEATQKIFLGTISRILPITPFAIAPLFSHGDPLRNESFILSASDVKPGKTISERIAETVNNRSTKGVIPRVRIVQTSPFQLIIPDNQGISASNILSEVDNFDGCTLFPIEATDQNMPLIGMLSSNKKMVVCGVDRVLGNEGKPVVFIAEIGFGLHFEKDGSFSDHTLLAPTQIGDSLEPKVKKDLQEIADKFSHKNRAERDLWQKEEQKFWESEFRELDKEMRRKTESVKNHRGEEFWEG